MDIMSRLTVQMQKIIHTTHCSMIRITIKQNSKKMSITAEFLYTHQRLHYVHVSITHLKYAAMQLKKDSIQANK